MSLEMKRDVLRTLSMQSLGTRELLKLFKKRNKTIINQIHEMKNQGLLRTTPTKPSSRGRPKEKLIVTELGHKYLKTYTKLEHLPLKSTKLDLMKAKRNIEYVNRLISRGKDPFKSFLELNEFVRAN